ncbi:unnamed protein product [Sphagnum jensenii]|jgi:hypothetical protein|uniref:Uncharacterized protein n=2 Tax=Sphagnum jensenii TaxID=128206 RepID=A0ABP1A042_9BRYO
MFCIWKADEHRCKETEARRRLTTTQEVLESDPQNDAAKEMVEAAKEDLNLVEEKKLRDNRTWSRVKWIRKGHAATEEFFPAIKQRAPRYYTQMLQGAIQEGRFPPGVTMSLITLLHKGGDKKSLSNW